MPDASEPLRIWCNFPFYNDLQELLRERTAAHELTIVDPSVNAPAEPRTSRARTIASRPDSWNIS